MKIGVKSLVVSLLILTGLFFNIATDGKVLGKGKHSGVIYVLADRNITADLDEGNVRARNDLADWWEADLINVLTKRGGYEAKLIRSREEFVAGPDTYLLTAKILNYHSVSTAARVFVGLGAGICTMDVHIELFGADNEQLLAKDDHVGSSRYWQNVARKINENILKAINHTFDSIQK